MALQLLMVVIVSVAFRTAWTSALQDLPSAYPSCGVLYNYYEASLINQGYTKCFDEPYSNNTIEAYLTACADMGYTFVFVGAKNSTDTTQFYVGSFGLSSNVFRQTNSINTAVLDPGGAYWYNYPTRSFGFASSSSIYLNSCDFGEGPGDCESRLCWHLSAGVGGYRAGCTVSLNSDSSWRKVIYLGNQTYSCQPELQSVSIDVVPQMAAIYEGTVNLLLRCKAQLDATKIISVEWYKDGQLLDEANNTEIMSLNLSTLNSVHTYISNLTHHIVTINDAGGYICNITYIPLNDTKLYSLTGNEVFIDVLDAPFNVSIDLTSIVPNGGNGRDIYNVACTAITPQGLALYKTFFWSFVSGKKAPINITYSSTETNNSYGSVSTSTYQTSFTSIASVSISCTVNLYYGEDLSNVAKEYTATLYLPGPSAPIEVENVTVKYSYELAIVSWVVPYTSYTPETYNIMYSTSLMYLNITAGQVPGSLAFSLNEEGYSIILQGLSSNTTYYYTIISSNSYGTVISSPLSFRTLTHDIYQVQNYEAIPIGAFLQVEFTILTALGNDVSFIAIDHTPAQHPSILCDYVASVNVTYSQVGFSLNGSYVLCIGDICGSKIFIDVTVPTLNTTSSTLVALISDIVNGNGASITCIPSDLRAPVKWNIAKDFPDASVAYSPDGLFHTVTFYSAPHQTFTIKCDLVNIEDEEVSIDPQEVNVRFISSPVVILNDDLELFSDPIINYFNSSYTKQLSLTCLGTVGHGNLSWISNGIQENSSQTIAINDQNVTFLLQGISNPHYYTCVSQSSAYSAHVFITLLSPIWKLVSTRNASLPVGVTFSIQYQYADISNGYFNQGPGFLVEIYLSPCYFHTNSELVYSGNTNQSVNYFDYNITSSTESCDLYTLNATYLGTGEVFSDTVQLITFVPEFIEAQSDIYALLDSNITLNCTPSDDRTPVYWTIYANREGAYDPTSYPEYFSFSPNSLNQTLTFNITNLLTFSASPISIMCYLFGYSRIQNIQVNIQNARVQIYQNSAQYQILNNSIINSFPINAPPDKPASSKRSYVLPSDVQIECTTVEGDEQPVWLSDNALVTDTIGQVVNNETLGIFVSQTTSTSVLNLNLLNVAIFIGTYTCQSRQSGESSNFFLTVENPYLKFEESPVITAPLGDEVNLAFKVAYDSTGLEDFSYIGGNITLEFSSFTQNGFQRLNAITPTMLTVNNYRFELGEVTTSYAGTYTVTLESSSDLFSAISDNITLLITVPELITSQDSLTLLAGDSAQLSCRTSVGSYLLHWVFDTCYSQNIYLGTTDEGIILSINNASASNSGKYGCVLTSAGTTIQKNITLQVLKACPRGVYGGVLWGKTAENTLVSKQCNEAGTYFRAGPTVSRYCQTGGTWAGADFSSCTLIKSATPLVLAWLVVQANSTESVQNVQNTLEDEIRAQLDKFDVPYSGVTLQSVYLSSVALTFQIFPLTTDSTFINAFSAFLVAFLDSKNVSSIGGYQIITNSEGYIAVEPTDSCPCASNLNATSSFFEALCNSASLSPCSCNLSICQCNEPFVGDGFSCTIDTDGDEYPDVILDSCNPGNQNKYCQKDNCPSVFNPGQDINACVPNLSSINSAFKGCPFGTDPVWNVTWANTQLGTTDIERCPGGVESFGKATRFCNPDGTWGDAVVAQCGSLKFQLILQQTQSLLGNIGSSYELLLEEGYTILQELTEATSPYVTTIPILPLDLNTTITIVANIIQTLMYGLELNNTKPPPLGLVDIFNNILYIKNLNGWLQLQTEQSGSQSLLYYAEQYAVYLAQASISPIVIGRENIVMSVRSVGKDNLTDMIFPNDADLENTTFASIQAKITIPKEFILERLTLNSNTNETSVPIANIIFNNINSFLPTNNTQLRASSLVISSQVYTSAVTPSPALLHHPIAVNFSFIQAEKSEVPQCVFWNFTAVLQNGSWSNTGVVTSSISYANSTVSIGCTSTHLTSFAILVDVAGGLQGASTKELAALNIVSYIGCAISILSLIATVIFFLYQGKKLFSAVHLFVHLNLCIALLLAYVVFVIGIETGHHSNGGCALVAALLQYLFLASFSWMLCEGIMLYLMLVVVFSTLAKRWWAFLIIGYGLPLPFVVIGIASRHEEYGVRDQNGNLQYCWLSTMYGTIWAFVAPMLAIIIVNCVFFALALCAIAKSRLKQRETTQKNRKLAISLLKSSIILLPLLGLTWIFGLLTINKYSTALAWIFTIINSLQGAAIFFFHVIRNEKVWARIQLVYNRLKKATMKTTTYQISSATKSKNENESVAIKMSEYVKSSTGFDSGSSDAPIELEPKEVKPEIHIISNVDATLHDSRIEGESIFNSGTSDIEAL